MGFNSGFKGLKWHQNIQEGWETKTGSQILAAGGGLVFVSLFIPIE